MLGSQPVGGAWIKQSKLLLFVMWLHGRYCAGIPPRQAGHFFLLAHKKVTKKEGLNTSHLVITLRTKANGKGSGTRTQTEDPKGRGVAIPSVCT